MQKNTLSTSLGFNNTTNEYVSFVLRFTLNAQSLKNITIDTYFIHQYNLFSAVNTKYKRLLMT